MNRIIRPVDQLLVPDRLPTTAMGEVERKTDPEGTLIKYHTWLYEQAKARGDVKQPVPGLIL